MQVKGNQPTLEANIVALFTRPDVAAWVDDCNVTMSRGHGRIETRTLRASSALRDMLDWPGQQQVFSIERRTIYVKTGEVREETAYGVTSLDPDRADAAKLQSLVQGQWSIENRSHYVRDVTFGEDKSQVRNGYLPSNEEYPIFRTEPPPSAWIPGLPLMQMEVTSALPQYQGHQ